MNATLLYIECNVFSGVMRIQLGQTVMSIELGTPNYNDYGEYRLASMEIKPLTLEKYQELFPHPLMNHKLCELSEEDMKFWDRHNQHVASEDDLRYLTDDDIEQIEISQDGNDYTLCGQDKEKVFHVWYNDDWVPFETWKSLDNANSYNKVMYAAAELFYNWYNGKVTLDFNPSNDTSLNIYPQ